MEHECMMYAAMWIAGGLVMAGLFLAIGLFLGLTAIAMPIRLWVDFIQAVDEPTEEAAVNGKGSVDPKHHAIMEQDGLV